MQPPQAVSGNNYQYLRNIYACAFFFCNRVRKNFSWKRVQLIETGHLSDYLIKLAKWVPGFAETTGRPSEIRNCGISACTVVEKNVWNPERFCNNHYRPIWYSSCNFGSVRGEPPSKASLGSALGGFNHQFHSIPHLPVWKNGYILKKGKNNGYWKIQKGNGSLGLILSHPTPRQHNQVFIGWGYSFSMLAQVLRISTLRSYGGGGV